MCQNVWKTALFLFSILVLTEAWSIKCYCNLTYYDEASEENAANLVHGPCFSISLKTYFYGYGFNGSSVTQDADKVVQAILDVGGTNICVIEWVEEARIPNITGTFLDDAYYVAVAKNSQSVGKGVGTAIVNMINAGMDREKTHLMGHSLGAQLAGAAGRQIINLIGNAIARITGCDPAGPLFGGILQLPHLSDECATFVNIVHTNPGHYGMKEATGHIDFYVNPKDDIQPGCHESTLLHRVIPFSRDDYCSHLRCVELLIEWTLHPHNFIASKAPDAKTWAENDGAWNYNTYMGNEVNTTYSGKYYLSTNEKSLYGRGLLGLKPRQK